MPITADQTVFLARRARMVRSWPLVGTVLIAGVFILWGWLMWSAPMLANPWAVHTRLASAAIPESTLALSAAILPILVFICLLLLLVMIVFAFVVIANERRYLAIIMALQDQSGVKSRRLGGSK
ncbi:MAG: hypothetical protein EOM91_16830 [Sphingobacteriia bacterium]|nr:hypothetical protein [Sphingobacteriia bacterium]NCC37950.1 hypothetical protein [Gammaproteobacteria bacterium]